MGGGRSDEHASRREGGPAPLSVLQLAEVLQNVSAACRQRGMRCTQFYDDQAAL
jgi:hypothetical protein